MLDSFATRDTLKVNGSSYQIASLPKLGQRFDIKRLRASTEAIAHAAPTDRRRGNPGSDHRDAPFSANAERYKAKVSCATTSSAKRAAAAGSTR